MQFFSKIISFLDLSSNKQQQYSFGPMTLNELIKQFDEPKKEKTNSDIIRDYQIKETMAALEIDMLKMEPATNFKGQQLWQDHEGKKFYDWVPCVIRPEVVYCSYGKN